MLSQTTLILRTSELILSLRMIYQNFLKVNLRYKIKGINITSNHGNFSNSSIHNRRCIRIRIHFGTAICNLSRPSLQNFGAVCSASRIKYLIHKRMHKVGRVKNTNFKDANLKATFE